MLADETSMGKMRPPQNSLFRHPSNRRPGATFTTHSKGKIRQSVIVDSRDSTRKAVHLWDPASRAPAVT